MQNMEEIYKQYFKVVYRYLLSLTHNEDISEELTQQTFYNAVRGIDNFKGNCKISVYLCQIAKNLLYNYKKKNNKIKEWNEEEIVNFIQYENVENIFSTKENKIELYKNIQKLDENTRNVIYLRITGELSFKEIGEILNKTENWARIVFYRGKLKLKEEFKNE